MPLLPEGPLLPSVIKQVNVLDGLRILVMLHLNGTQEHMGYEMPVALFHFFMHILLEVNSALQCFAKKPFVAIALHFGL